MAHEKLKQAIGNLAGVEHDAHELPDVARPILVARCAEATRDGFEAILAELEGSKPLAEPISRVSWPNALCLCGHDAQAHANRQTACNGTRCSCQGFCLDYKSVLVPIDCELEEGNSQS